MRKIQSTVAKSHFAELLRAVEQGEAIAITRHGKTVAHLVPAGEQDLANRERALEMFRQRRTEWKRVAFTTNELLASRHEGHSL